MIKEMPRYADNLVPLLGEPFNLTLQQYELLNRCDRDDRTKFALSPKDVTAAERKMLRPLEEKAMVTYSEKMGKWELTTIGQAIRPSYRRLIWRPMIINPHSKEKDN